MKNGRKIHKVMFKSFQIIEEERAFTNSFFENLITLIPTPGKAVTRKESHKKIPLMNIEAK